MIRTIGIIGSGKMGSDIFNYLSDYDFMLCWHILFDDEREKLEKSFVKKISRQMKHGLINQEQFHTKSSFCFTNDLNKMDCCDLIIESITEDVGEKRRLFENLQKIIKEECIIASNSSSILPSVLSTYFPVTGMHFFYPLSFKDIVELIIHDGVKMHVETLSSFLKTINKKVFIQNEQQAFLLNRFLLKIQLKAFELIKNLKISYRQTDQVVKKILPDFGLFEMMDHVGLQTMYNSISNYAEMEKSTCYKDLLSEIESKITRREKLCDEGDRQNLVNDALNNEILQAVQNEMNETLEVFVNKYDIDKDFFKDSLSDFLGINFNNF